MRFSPDEDVIRLNCKFYLWQNQIVPFLEYSLLDCAGAAGERKSHPPQRLVHLQKSLRRTVTLTFSHRVVRSSWRCYHSNTRSTVEITARCSLHISWASCESPFITYGSVWNIFHSLTILYFYLWNKMFQFEMDWAKGFSRFRTFPLIFEYWHTFKQNQTFFLLRK